MTEFGILTHVGSSIFLKGNGKASSLDIAPLFLQSWTAALYNLGNGSWLAM